MVPLSPSGYSRRAVSVRPASWPTSAMWLSIVVSDRRCSSRPRAPPMFGRVSGCPIADPDEVEAGTSTMVALIGGLLFAVADRD